jgi:hypothetical protein
MNTLTLGDLRIQLEDLGDRFPALKQHELFVLWFLRAYIIDDEQTAFRAVAGGAKDKGVDGVLIDDAARAVFLVQSKYRQKFAVKNESRNDVLGFAQLSCTIADPEASEFDKFIQNTEPYVSDLLKKARQKIIKSNYKLWLYYVTLGKCSASLENDAKHVVKRAECDAAIEIFAGRRILLLLRDYLDGAAPPIPVLDLEMEVGSGIVIKSVLQRYDDPNKIESWAFTIRGSSVGDLVDAAGIRLFARNIRGFMGESTPVNRGMAKTLEKEADHFFYYNNGITIVCDRAEKLSRNGKDVLRVSNPQIINGQQTSRMLAAHPTNSRAASVLVKVMEVPRGEAGTSDGFDSLVSRIVAGTNWQNSIRPSDLMSNDRRQIEIERSFRKLGYSYLRKRQTKGETRRIHGGKRQLMIKKEDLAQAVAACELDPVVPRSGKDNLFHEDLYTMVFPNTDPNYYLSRYWLMQDVSSLSKGFPRRGYAKWLVLGFMWSQISPLVRSAKGARSFRFQHERSINQISLPMSKAIDLTYRVALRYYNRHKGEGERALDISAFFRSKRGRDKEFLQFWKGRDNSNRDRFDRLIERIAAGIQDFEN